VASLSGSKGPSTSTTTLPKGTPTELLDEWASCMRTNGYPNLADPTIDSGGAIHITITNATNPSSNPTQNSCSPYLNGASKALGGGGAGGPKVSPAKLLAFSKCMRAHGISDFPDPSPGGGISIHTQPGSDLNPNDPAFQTAQKACAKATGTNAFNPSAPHPGAIQVSETNGPGPGPAGNPGQSNGVTSGGGGGANSQSVTGGSGG
jgi:hypothetical protein